MPRGEDNFAWHMEAKQQVATSQGQGSEAPLIRVAPNERYTATGVTAEGYLTFTVDPIQARPGSFEWVSELWTGCVFVSDECNLKGVYTCIVYVGYLHAKHQLKLPFRIFSSGLQI